MPIGFRITIDGPVTSARGHSEYCIHTSIGTRDHEARRRYSEFVELHSSLMQALGGAWDDQHLQLLPPLPPKLMFHTRASLVTRLNLLEFYLRALVGSFDLAMPAALIQFLGLGTDVSWDQISGSDNEAALRARIASLEAEVLTMRHAVEQKAAFPGPAALTTVDAPASVAAAVLAAQQEAHLHAQEADKLRAQLVQAEEAMTAMAMEAMAVKLAARKVAEEKAQRRAPPTFSSAPPYGFISHAEWAPAEPFVSHLYPLFTKQHTHALPISPHDFETPHDFVSRIRAEGSRHIDFTALEEEVAAEVEPTPLAASAAEPEPNWLTTATSTILEHFGNRPSFARKRAPAPAADEALNGTPAVSTSTGASHAPGHDNMQGAEAAIGPPPPPLPDKPGALLPVMTRTSRATSYAIGDGMSGYLYKKSGGKGGGKEGSGGGGIFHFRPSDLKFAQKWSKRWFDLPPNSSILSYYKSEADCQAGRPALGEIECAGATVFLKEVVKGGVHRFTVRSPIRDLKLRAPDPKTYASWISAMRAFAAGFAEFEEEESARLSRARSESTQSYIADDDDDDDDSDGG